MTDTIDISGLSKAQVLAALYNASSPGGMGFLAAAMTPGDMTIEQAQEIIQSRTDFDYLNGRSFKVNLTGDTFDPWLYDRDNGGPGTAEMIIERLRGTGSVSSAESVAHREAITADRVYQFPVGIEVGEFIADVAQQWAEIIDEGLPREVPADMTARQHLDWSSDQALKFYHGGNADKALLVFLVLVGADDRTAWIVTHPATPMLMQVGVMGGRHELEHMMKGFAA